METSLRACYLFTGSSDKPGKGAEYRFTFGGFHGLVGICGTGFCQSQLIAGGR
jgi:hypothetical protein